MVCNTSLNTFRATTVAAAFSHVFWRPEDGRGLVRLRNTPQAVPMQLSKAIVLKHYIATIYCTYIIYLHVLVSPSLESHLDLDSTM